MVDTQKDICMHHAIESCKCENTKSRMYNMTCHPNICPDREVLKVSPDDNCLTLMKLDGTPDQTIKATPYQTAKADAGKLELTLVPRQIIREIARVRMYGKQKYKDPDIWKTLSPERLRNAAYRHFLSYLDDPSGVDEESGISHLSHLATNIAFLIELESKD